MRVLQAVSVVQSCQTSCSKPSLVLTSARLLAPPPSSRLSLSLSLSLSSSVQLSSIGGSVAAVRSSVKLVRGRTGQVVCMAVTNPKLVEVLVKAAVGDPHQLGDCPFSQRVLLTLEEKGIPYEAKYIDSSNKPAWFLEANPEGKVPVIKDDGKWVADSDVITELLEKKFPDPPLAAPPNPVGSKLFSAFNQFLTSKDPNDGKEQALLSELKALDTHLKAQGPYLNGEKISSLDLALAPKLYHLTVALGHYKKWSIPAEYSSLNSYIEAVHSRESFQKTKAPEAVVVKGWEAKDKCKEEDVLSEDALQLLLTRLEESKVLVGQYNEDVCSDADIGEERQRVVYLETWQYKKLAAAANLGAHCINVEALAAEVGVHRSDVLAWLQNTPSKTVRFDIGPGSYMEDVFILEEEDKTAKYVQPPPIPEGDVDMRNRVEDLLYTLKDVFSGPLTSVVDDERTWDAIAKLFSETVKVQDPLFCLQGKNRVQGLSPEGFDRHCILRQSINLCLKLYQSVHTGFLEWLQLLAQSGVVIDLHDIYYENIASKQFNRWVYAIWTATLTNDLWTSIVQLGLTDWWAKNHSQEFTDCQNQRDLTDLEDYDGHPHTELDDCAQGAGCFAGKEGDDEQNEGGNDLLKFTFNTVLRLSGEARLEMDESGQVTNVHTRWYKMVKQRDVDFTNAKLWLAGLLNRGSS